ncbi:mediator complex subunit 27 domain-containing protein [Ditylenchus destructor]|uniref:Mediator complex subunit 27 domain-containing protein n=1 Tax=Ditylenchus destructor TaxID=166010 RepID=A0AAD4R3C3_9BILA|nr:mediator complex subunit 27 domain-containing protein [Ditylenchus destructor]
MPNPSNFGYLGGDTRVLRGSFRKIHFGDEALTKMAMAHPCPFCKTNLASKANLQRHIKSLHADADDQMWCVCHQISNTMQMVCCDRMECNISWFHWKCVGLTQQPGCEWFCEACNSTFDFYTRYSSRAGGDAPSTAPISNNPVDAKFEALYNLSNRCLQSVRSIRNLVLQTHEFISAGFENEAGLAEYKAKLAKYGKDIEDEYNKLEAEAKQLPSQTPAFTMANRLSNLLLDVASNRQSTETYLNSRDAFDWSQTTNEYVTCASGFLESSQGNQRARRTHTGPSHTVEMPEITNQSTLRNTHKSFGESFKKYMVFGQRQYPDRLKYAYEFLEEGERNSVLEVKLFSHPSEDYMTVDKQPVCMLKFLLLVNNGVVEYIQFIAPHENWTYLEINKRFRRQLDLSAESRYEVYRQLTIQCNIVLNTIKSRFSHDKSVIHFLLNHVFNFHTLDNVCEVCKKVLKDFMPPTICNTQTRDGKRAFYHSGCK